MPVPSLGQGARLHAVRPAEMACNCKSCLNEVKVSDKSLGYDWGRKKSSTCSNFGGVMMTAHSAATSSLMPNTNKQMARQHTLALRQRMHCYLAACGSCSRKQKESTLHMGHVGVLYGL